MGSYVDCTIVITKGDPKEVLDVVRTKESVINLSTIATGRHYRQPFNKAFYGEVDAEYSTKDGVTVITFWVKNWTPDAIFDDLAERFPEHEFAVVREFEEIGEDELLLKNGQCKLVRSRRWEWSEKRQRFTAIRDTKWGWEGVKQEGSFDIRREFEREEQEWYDQQHPESALARKAGRVSKGANPGRETPLRGPEPKRVEPQHDQISPRTGRNRECPVSTVKTEPQSVRSMWQQYFPNIELIETKWFENYEPDLLMDAMRIAAENRKKGKQFDVLDEKNVGRYVIGILRKLRSPKVVNKSGGDIVASAEVHFPAGYEVTDDDSARFSTYLEASGDCLLFNGASTARGYGKFWVDGRSVYAHIFAFFSELGYLPAPNALGGVNGLQVAHDCGKRACCNAHHLRLTTKAVNLMERAYSRTQETSQGTSKGDYGSTNGSLNKCTDTPYTGSEISNSLASNPTTCSGEPLIQEIPTEGVTVDIDSGTSAGALEQNADISGQPDLVDSLYTVQNNEEGVSG